MSGQLPCFGAACGDEPPPAPPPGDDGAASASSDEAVTVRDIPVSAPAGEVLHDAGDALDAALGAEAAGLEDEVASAAEFLAQMPAHEAEAVVASLAGGGCGASGRPELGEAALFVRSLICHLPDRAAALGALRGRLAASQPYGGAVSQFLTRRRRNRERKVRIIGPWEEHFTRGDASAPTRRYYYNNVTQKTQWDPPPEFEGMHVAEEAEESNDGDTEYRWLNGMAARVG